MYCVRVLKVLVIKLMPALYHSQSGTMQVQRRLFTGGSGASGSTLLSIINSTDMEDVNQFYFQLRQYFCV
jgi:hypothetical protein